MASLRAPAELVASIDAARYDEVSFYLSAAQPPGADAQIMRGLTGPDLHAALQDALEHDAVAERSLAKLFQAESYWSALIAMPDPASERTAYHFITSDTV